MTTDDEVTQLALQAGSLLASIDRLNGDTGAQMVRLAQVSRRHRRLIFGLAISLAVDIILTLVLGMGLNELHSTSGQVKDVTTRLNVEQTVQKQRALCPLYQLFIDSENPTARAQSPGGPAAYDHAFAVIRDGYAALNCQSVARGSAP